jgi:DNA-directed RNA polymerases I and III subunit RPAC1
MVGIDAPLANALRRIMIAEVCLGSHVNLLVCFNSHPPLPQVPTLAIETVNIYQNTSIMQDEVLAHRLGLIPINADPRKFKYVSECEEPDETNTIVFTLEAKCTFNQKADRNAPPSKLYKDSEGTPLPPFC